MKRLVTLILLFTLSLTITVAAKQNEMLSVKQLVQKVKNSTGDERRIAMNALKIKLRSINQEMRRKIIVDLQSNVSKKQVTHSTKASPKSFPSSVSHQSAPSMHNVPPRQSTPQSTPQRTPQNTPAPHFGPPGGHR